MGRHEHFEDLCAAASVGQASGQELAELREHLAGCSDCQQTYSDFLQLSAVPCASSNEQEVTSAEAIGYIDSALFREKFLKKAEAEGIIFSRDRIRSSMPERRSQAIKSVWHFRMALGVGASALLLVGVIGGYHLRSRGTLDSTHAGRAPDGSPPLLGQNTSTDQNREASISHLEVENRRLTSEIASLKAFLKADSSTLDRLQRTAALSEKERASLLSANKERDSRIDDLQRQLSVTQAEATNIRVELTRAQEANQDTLVADQARIGELSEQLAEQSSALERERQLLTANRDIRDLMAARNLHIADVFDTDPRGKTRRAFGRVFFTEGKSLIIYAYDLNDRRVQDAGYHYRVWGKKEGPGRSAKSLGIFYSDDKAQKRWVFKYDDPKVLNEIDSVFVTLEPPGKNPTEPKGDKFLYAYLRNQPNHP